MKEYSNGGKTVQEQYFGLKLCQERMVIECSFRRLKARFGALRRAMDINVGDLHYVIYACFILHDSCEQTMKQSVKTKSLQQLTMIESSSSPGFLIHNNL